MSWLQPATEARAHNSSDRPADFAGRTVVVERDLESGQMVTETIDGMEWVCAWPSYELLARHHGVDDIDHMQMTGRELKNRLRSQQMRTVGVMWRPTLDDEQPMIFPQAAPIARVTFQ